MTTYQISRHGLLDWVHAHELMLFFAFVFLFSWTIYGVLAMIEVPNNTTLSRLELLAAYGPSLSAILLSATTARAAHQQAPGMRWVLFLGIASLVIGTEWLDHIWWRHPIDASTIGADIVLIAVAIFVAFRMTVDRNNLPEMSVVMSWWRKNWRWCLVALGLWPALIIAGNFIADALSLSQPAAPSLPAVPFLLLVLESFVWFLLLGGPLNEEPGWRGFALPRLCRRFSPLVASILLGALWGLWHVPLHFMGAYYGGPLGAIIRIQEIPRAVLFTWLYNRTNGSLLIVLLFHAAINTTGLFLSRSYLITLILCTLLAGWVIVRDRMWVKKPSI